MLITIQMKGEGVSIYTKVPLFPHCIHVIMSSASVQVDQYAQLFTHLWVRLVTDCTGMDFISFDCNEQRVSTFRKTTMDKFTFFLVLLIKNNLG